MMYTIIINKSYVTMINKENDIVRIKGKLWCGYNYGCGSNEIEVPIFLESQLFFPSFFYSFFVRHKTLDQRFSRFDIYFVQG